MRINWQTRLEQQPELRELEAWPQISADTLPREKRKTYLRNLGIIAKVLAGESRDKIARTHNISQSRISQLLNRCLGGQSYDAPVLTRGLIPHDVVVKRQRRQPLATHQQARGNACAFRQLLEEVPGLAKELDTMIEAHLKDSAYAQQITPMSFHGEFKRLLAEANWPPERYPYTTTSLAYESVRGYLHRRTAELQQARQARQQPPARVFGITPPSHRALRAVQIDEHIIDLQGRIHLQLNEELIPLRLARANLLLAVDVDTQCILGYHLAPTEVPNQQDLLTLLDNCIQPWQPLTLLTHGLSYAPGAGFPSGLDEAFPVSFGLVQMDNAMMHHAHSIRHFLCHQMGATLSLGPPGMAKIRELVESIFDYLNQKISHRVRSTTGSSPVDPKRESRKLKKRIPLITLQTLNEAFSVLFTEYNITPSADLGHSSPLALFQHHCQHHFIRYVPKFLREQWHPFITSQEVAFHWYKDEHRLPHVNFMYGRYQGPGLLSVAGKTRRVRIAFDRRDIRTLHAYTLGGNDLGTLYVDTRWQRFPHSLATRQLIHKLTKKTRLNSRDPLSWLFHHLLENKGKPQTALSLLQVYSEFTAGMSGPLILGESDEPPTPQLPPNAQRPEPFSWQTSIANHRR